VDTCRVIVRRAFADAPLIPVDPDQENGRRFASLVMSHLAKAIEADQVRATGSGGVRYGVVEKNTDEGTAEVKGSALCLHSAGDGQRKATVTATVQVNPVNPSLEGIPTVVAREVENLLGNFEENLGVIATGNVNSCERSGFGWLVTATFEAVSASRVSLSD
jgi:hypothetical protein